MILTLSEIKNSYNEIKQSMFRIEQSIENINEIKQIGYYVFNELMLKLILYVVKHMEET